MLVYLFGFVSGVLVMVLVRFVASCVVGGRHAEPPVICVEVGTQVDLLAYDEKMVEELVDGLSSRLLQPELVALADLFGSLPGVRARKTVIAMEAIETELVKKENLEMWVHRAQHAHVDHVKRRG